LWQFFLERRPAMDVKKKVTIVSDCPRCKSKKTGILIKYYGNDIDKYLSSFLKKGILARPQINTEDNCFCNDCGASWYEPVHTKMMAQEEIEELKKEKGIDDDIIDSYYNHDYYNRLQKKHKHTLNLIDLSDLLPLPHTVDAENVKKEDPVVVDSKQNIDNADEKQNIDRKQDDKHEQECKKKKEGFLAYMFKCSIGNVTGALQDSVSLFHNKKE
jgi:hypothetical protein